MGGSGAGKAQQIDSSQICGVQRLWLADPIANLQIVNQLLNQSKELGQCVGGTNVTTLPPGGGEGVHQNNTGETRVECNVSCNAGLISMVMVTSNSPDLL